MDRKNATGPKNGNGTKKATFQDKTKNWQTGQKKREALEWWAKGGPASWGPEGWGGPKFRFFVPPPAAKFVLFFPLLGVLSWNFGGFLKCRGPEMCTFGVLGLSCASPKNENCGGEEKKARNFGRSGGGVRRRGGPGKRAGGAHKSWTRQRGPEPVLWRGGHEDGWGGSGGKWGERTKHSTQHTTHTHPTQPKQQHNSTQQHNNNNTTQHTDVVFFACVCFFCPFTFFCPDNRLLVLSRMSVFFVPFAFFLSRYRPLRAPTKNKIGQMWSGQIRSDGQMRPLNFGEMRSRPILPGSPSAPPPPWFLTLWEVKGEVGPKNGQNSSWCKTGHLQIC